MGNWSEVPRDLLEFIVKRIHKLDDFVRFGAVCKSWHAAAEKGKFKGVALREHIPYLMLAAEEDGREFYSLQEHQIVAKVSLPCLEGKKCIESLGWWLIVGSEGDMSLLNPFSGVEIELPHYTTFPGVNVDDFISGDPFTSVQRMVLSSRPDKSSDFVVMVLAGNYNLGFWRPGDHKWNSLQKCMVYRDLTYFSGKFYGISDNGFIVVFDLAGPNPRKGRILIDFKYQLFDFMERVCEKNLYIVEFSGALLVIARDARKYNAVTQRTFYDTSQFRLFKVDPSSGRWEEIYSLGSKAAFVGHGSTTLVETSKFHEFKANHIYYTIDCWHLNVPDSSFKDVGVYNFETKDIEPFYHGDEGKLSSQISPPVWVTPSFM